MQQFLGSFLIKSLNNSEIPYSTQYTYKDPPPNLTLQTPAFTTFIFLLTMLFHIHMTKIHMDATLIFNGRKPAVLHHITMMYIHHYLAHYNALLQLYFIITFHLK